MITIDKFNFAGKKAFVRVDFNVPLDADFNITDDTRIRAALPTLKKIIADGGSPIIASHLGRPKGVEDKYSLKHILAHVSKLLGVDLQFASDCASEEAAMKAAALQPGEALLLENLRFYAEEEGKPRGLADDASDEVKAAAKKAVKESQKEFTKTLASYADVYVNDAFGTAHRAQASTYGVAEFAPVACAGPLLAAELDALGKALKEPARPMVAIVGGSKVSTKLEVLNSLSKIADQIIVGGGIANTFIAAAGHNVGKSLYEADLIPVAKELAASTDIPVPVDVRVGTEFSETAPATEKSVTEVKDDESIFDIGDKSAEQLAEIIKNAKTVLWNGPVGVFEFPNFRKGTEIISHAIANSDAFSIAGGGDTLAAIDLFGIADKISYISTGGGAFLEFVEGKVLPAVEILEKRANG